MNPQRQPTYDPLPYAKIAEYLQRLLIYSALSIMVWTRPDLGSRVLTPGIGIISLILILGSFTVADSNQSLGCLVWAVSTLIVGSHQRFKRWREFRRGVRHYSYSLGTAGMRRWLPKFLCRHRYPERMIEPLYFAILGIFLLKFIPPMGMWVIFAAFCIAGVEQSVFVRQEEEQRDLVDGMVKSEIQVETVEKFSDPIATAHTPPGGGGAIPTGLAGDIGGKRRDRRNRPERN